MGKRRWLLALLATAVMAAPAGAAEEWVPVGETDDLQDYFDARSIVRRGDWVSAWFLDNFFEAQVWHDRRKAYFSRKSRVHFDCRDRLFAVDEVVLFAGPNGEGRVLDQSPAKRSSELRFEGVPPESLLADMMDVACGYAPEDEPLGEPGLRV